MRKAKSVTNPELVDVPGRNDIKWMPGNDLVKRIKAAVAADTITVKIVPARQNGRKPLALTGLSDAPPGFLSDYARLGFEEADPTLQEMLRRGEPVDDLELQADGASNPELDGILAQHHIKNRTMLPVIVNSRTLGWLCLSRSDKFTRSEMSFLQWAARPLLESLVTTYLGDGLARSHGLTNGEVICLQLASQGYSSEKISTETSFSFQTVNSYLKDAARKLGAANRTEAVVCALKYGIIV